MTPNSFKASAYFTPEIKVGLYASNGSSHWFRLLLDCLPEKSSR